ncbi:class I SAM-dependent methyltransferase [Caldalkalibacillus mannanilyticus]|uniref:class I SAM-dependent methyltransferase n=1 Tax=Caldalkalibacillus mannanilyticus TaxID=1418 RepID=UPI00046A048B|nr:SAM-dependent methyltransferase [Caldalkalibacillus mannanilyticus]
MEKIEELLTQVFQGQALIQASLSHTRSNEPEGYKKVTIKPIELKGERIYQFSYFYEKKVAHENLLPGQATEKTFELFQQKFKQGIINTLEADYQILISKKFKVSILKKKPTKQKIDLSHNRKKHYILEEGKPVPFLIELGVMNAEGKVLAKKYDKFRQINRFLEIIQDVVPYLSKNGPIRIVDFGCGKSYLTFALHYYLKELQGLEVKIIGLDLKKDVIQHCQSLVQKFGFNDLHFMVGDIADYNELDQVNMVVTLHACDTATDAALEKAVRWGAEVILSVPCCQHELHRQIEQVQLEPMLRHGIIRERFSALATDSIRAQLLDIMGYKTQILEFIDMEHTAKNLLLRAIKTSANDQEHLVKEYLMFKQFLKVEPYLEKALHDRLIPLFEKKD